ncbi:MAG: glycoside hydrolase family 13 protein [Bacteroidia bacterium]
MIHFSKCFCTFVLLLLTITQAQIHHVEPPHWWVGMRHTSLQLLVHGNDIGTLNPSLTYEGVTLTKVSKGDSPNYLFIDLEIAENTSPGKMLIAFTRRGKRVYDFQYELKRRPRKMPDYQGFDASDVIYLITPDRFANATPGNDSDVNLRQQGIDRNDHYARHGGDLAGITQHLDYIAEMGFTAIWPSPMLENNMKTQSYHGYAITDLYKVDPRFGTLEEYKALADEARERDIKLIMDVVSNHCGSGHWWMEDLPFSDWLNYQDSIVTTSHRRTVNQDAYASEADRKKMTGGWFVPSMPDLNQSNSFMATYLIQNSIWWVETLGLGGIRQDTWPYPDKQFLADWSCRIMKEYPNFNIVGEEWSYNPLLVAYWQQGNPNKDGYQTCLKSTMDFPMQKVLMESLNEPERWDKGLVKLYEGLANDFAYVAPQDLLIFGDNHDMNRIHTSMGNDPAKTKMAVAWLLTMRGIPQLYYGTEILMENSAKPGDHGLIRSDFPGGWKGDSINAFTQKNLSTEQLDMQNYVQTLLNWRKNKSLIHNGKTKHFAPENATYVYFRYEGERAVMVAINRRPEAVTLDLARFKEIIKPGTSAQNVMTGERIQLGQSLKLAPEAATILEW